MARLVVHGLGGTVADLLRFGFGAGEFSADPAAVWNYLLPNGVTTGNALMAVYNWVNELHRIHGLNATVPLVVTETNRGAGVAIQQTLVDDGNGNITVTRQ
jgi:hypothetical protein